MENEITIYQPDEMIKLDVRLENETVWLSQAQMCELFQRERSVITKHINNIFKEKELIKKSVCANFAHTAIDGKIYQVAFYNLDVIISVGKHNPIIFKPERIRNEKQSSAVRKRP